VRGEIADAVLILRKALQVMPYDAMFYRLLGKGFLSLNKTREATQILRTGVQIFPQDPEIRELLKQSETSNGEGGAPSTR